MNAAFQPKRMDGRPLWRVIFDEIEGRHNGGLLKLGDIIGDDELRGILTEEEQPRFYQAVLRASQELEQIHKRVLIRERGLGYRFDGGMEQARQGRRQKRKGLRRIERGLSLSLTTDHSLLSSDERSSVDRMTRGMAILAMHAKMTDERFLAQEEQNNEFRHQHMTTNSRLKATDEEVSELRRRLEEMEKKTNN